MGSLALNFLCFEMKKSRNRNCSRLGSTEKKISSEVSNPNYGLGTLLKTAEIESKISATRTGKKFPEGDGSVKRPHRGYGYVVRSGFDLARLKTPVRRATSVGQDRSQAGPNRSRALKPIAMIVATNANPVEKLPVCDLK